MSVEPDALEEDTSFLEMMQNILIFILIFGMSATVEIGSIEEQLKNIKAIRIGVLLQFVVLPFFGFATVNILGLDKALGIPLLTITTSPGGFFSNWWTSLFNGDLGLSVTMTFISTLIALVVLPLNLLLYGSLTYGINMLHDIDWSAFFLSISVILSAFLLGLCYSAATDSQEFRYYAYALGNLSGIFMVVFSFSVLTNQEESDLCNKPLLFFLGAAFTPIFALITSNAISKYSDLSKPERVTVAIECCYQNIGFAISIVIYLFKGSDLSRALSVPVYYACIEAAIVFIYCISTWKKGWTKAPRDEFFLTVITKSYELDDTRPPMDLYEIIQ